MMRASPNLRTLFLGTLITATLATIALTAWLVLLPMWNNFRTARQLADLLLHPDHSRRLDAAQKLAEMGPDAWPAMPVLVELATGTASHSVPAKDPSGQIRGHFELRGDYPLRIAAAGTLGRIGRPARSNVPALCEALVRETKSVRGPAERHLVTACCDAIEQIGFDKHVVVPALLECLTSRDTTIWRRAADFLSRVDRELAIEAFLDVRAKASGGIRRSAIIALGELGPDAVVAVPLLTEDLHDPSGFVCLNAAEAIWKITAKPDLPVPALVDLLRPREPYFPIELAAQALARIGPPAKDALPALQSVMESDDEPKASRAAAEAITAIVRAPGR